VPTPDRETRKAQLAALESAGMPPTPIWLRFLTEEDINVAGDTALLIIAERYGGDGPAIVEQWHAEISAVIEEAVDKNSANYRSATLIALREGPRLSMLLLPDAAYARALRPHAQILDKLLSRSRAKRRCPLRRRTA
jgi:hypothetical protein